MTDEAKDLGVRVILAFEFYSVGKVIFPPGGVRSTLIARGFVEPVKPAQEKRKNKEA